MYTDGMMATEVMLKIRPGGGLGTPERGSFSPTGGAGGWGQGAPDAEHAEPGARHE